MSGKPRRRVTVDPVDDADKSRQSVFERLGGPTRAAPAPRRPAAAPYEEEVFFFFFKKYFFGFESIDV